MIILHYFVIVVVLGLIAAMLHCVAFHRLLEAYDVYLLLYTDTCQY